MSIATEYSQPFDAAVPQTRPGPAPSRPASPTPSGRQRPRREQPPLRLVSPSRSHRLPMLFGLVAVAVLAVMFGFAAFHSQMASTQYELEEVQRELSLEHERLVDLQIQLDELNSPAQIERLARGALGMVDPSTPVDVVVDESLVAEVADASRLADGGSAGSR